MFSSVIRAFRASEIPSKPRIIPWLVAQLSAEPGATEDVSPLSSNYWQLMRMDWSRTICGQMPMYGSARYPDDQFRFLRHSPTSWSLYAQQPTFTVSGCSCPRRHC
jgi:hypothetical protein